MYFSVLLSAPILALIIVQEDIQEDWGWKLVHGEVFRTPGNPMVLSIMVGNGAQLCAMVGVTLGGSAATYCNAAYTISIMISVCFVGLPFPIESRFTWHRDDGMLDDVWKVCL